MRSFRLKNVCKCPRNQIISLVFILLGTSGWEGRGGQGREERQAKGSDANYDDVKIVCAPCAVARRFGVDPKTQVPEAASCSCSSGIPITLRSTVEPFHSIDAPCTRARIILHVPVSATSDRRLHCVNTSASIYRNQLIALRRESISSPMAHIGGTHASTHTHTHRVVTRNGIPIDDIRAARVLSRFPWRRR